MYVLSFFHTKKHLNNVDILTNEPIKFDLLNKKSKKIKIKNITIPVVSLEHLICLKKNSSRAKDVDDITNLKAIKKIKNNYD